VDPLKYKVVTIAVGIGGNILGVGLYIKVIYIVSKVRRDILCRDIIQLVVVIVVVVGANPTLAGMCKIVLKVIARRRGN